MECCGDEDGWHSDERSRGLSHHSTGVDAGGLDFRVRDGTGYYPSAVAVHTASSNLMNREAYWTEAHLWLGCKKIVKIARGVSAAGLNTSANLGAYTRCLSNSSSTSPLRCLVFRMTSSLDAFSSYPLERGYPALPCRTTGKLVAPSPRSSRTKGPFRSGILRASTAKQQTCLTTV